MPEIGAIILAAGMSKRMGEPKLLLDLHEKPVFRYAVEAAAAARLHPVILIGGEHVEQFKAHTGDLPVEVHANPDYAEGMASSLRCGIAALNDRADGALVFLADQPYVPSVVIHTLLNEYGKSRMNGIRILRPSYNGKPGHPVLFDRAVFPALAAIQGDEGGRSVIRQNPHMVKTVPFENALWGSDIDTKEDYIKMKKAGIDHADRL
jgi:molybdenum cofactor cytidylyltransferase